MKTKLITKFFSLTLLLSGICTWAGEDGAGPEKSGLRNVVDLSAYGVAAGTLAYGGYRAVGGLYNALCGEPKEGLTPADNALARLMATYSHTKNWNDLERLQLATQMLSVIDQAYDADRVNVPVAAATAAVSHSSSSSKTVAKPKLVRTRSFDELSKKIKGEASSRKTELEALNAPARRPECGTAEFYKMLTTGVRAAGGQAIPGYKSDSEVAAMARELDAWQRAHPGDVYSPRGGHIRPLTVHFHSDEGKRSEGKRDETKEEKKERKE